MSSKADLKTFRSGVERISSGIRSHSGIDLGTAKPEPVIQPAAKDSKPADAASLLQQRSNIYQHDEFDVFSRDSVDTSRIHKGKKGDKISAKKVFNDKTHLAGMQSTIEEYSYEYEDEYDDTYDANDVGADDADSADELTSRRPFMVPRVLRGAREGSSSGEEDELDAEPLPGSETRDTRQPYSRQQAGRGGGPGGGRGGGRSAAVQGQPKGKGQSKDTQKARNTKDKHKASRANHNRKAMADKKRSKGMGPLS